LKTEGQNFASSASPTLTLPDLSSPYHCRPSRNLFLRQLNTAAQCRTSLTSCQWFYDATMGMMLFSCDSRVSYRSSRVTESVWPPDEILASTLSPGFTLFWTLV